jgi:hypothetical protein
MSLASYSFTTVAKSVETLTSVAVLDIKNKIINYPLPLFVA